MGTIITVVLALLIFGIGLTTFYKSIHKELTTGKCAGCSGCKDSSCCSSKVINLETKEIKLKP